MISDQATQDKSTVRTPLGRKSPRKVPLTVGIIKTLLNIAVLVSIRLQYAPAGTTLWVPSVVHLLDIFLYVVLWIEVWVHMRPSRSHVVAWVTFAVLWGATTLSITVAVYAMGWNSDAKWWHRYLLKPVAVVLDVVAIAWLVHALIKWATQIRSDERKSKEDAPHQEDPQTRDSNGTSRETHPEEQQGRRNKVTFEELCNQQPTPSTNCNPQ